MIVSLITPSWLSLHNPTFLTLPNQPQYMLQLQCTFNQPIHASTIGMSPLPPLKRFDSWTSFFGAPLGLDQHLESAQIVFWTNLVAFRPIFGVFEVNKSVVDQPSFSLHMSWPEHESILLVVLVGSHHSPSIRKNSSSNLHH